MKNSLIIIGFFLAGIGCGWSAWLPQAMALDRIQLFVLYLLLFLVGLSAGSNAGAWKLFRAGKGKFILVPLLVIMGSLLGGGLASLLLPGLSLTESLAICSGMGYYSLSSVLIARAAGETLGVLALLSNISREVITLLLAPLLADRFGKLAPIASGGATSMDTTLPIITRCTGSEYAILAVFNGFLLTAAVPFLVTGILEFR